MSPKKQKEKAYHALAYFLKEEEVLLPYKTKLFKLLYYLDFLHFEKYGRSATGLQYFAWENGPVPRDIWHKWTCRDPEILDRFQIKNDQLGGGKIGHTLRPKFDFDGDLFSQSELEIMKALARKHFRHTGREMSERSHLEAQPWHEVRVVQDDPDGPIDYELTLLRKLSERDKEILELSRFNKAMQNQLSR